MCKVLMLGAASCLMIGCASTTPPHVAQAPANLMIEPTPLEELQEGATDKELLQIIVNNYESCVADKDRLNALQSWARQPKK